MGSFGGRGQPHAHFTGCSLRRRKKMLGQETEGAVATRPVYWVEPKRPLPQDRVLVFLTNQLTVAAATVAAVYKVS